jgi:hypothetical protein
MSKYNDYQNIYERLYKFKSPNEKFELEKCSFMPNTNKEKGNNSMMLGGEHIVRGYEKQIERMNMAKRKDQ